MRRSIIFALAAGMLGAPSCYTDYVYDPYGYYGYNDPYGYDYGYVGPGVSIVAGYDYPVFYSNNYYWRYNHGNWYRSHDHYGNWSYYAHPPAAVVGIRNPGSYHYPYHYNASRHGYYGHGGYDQYRGHHGGGSAYRGTSAHGQSAHRGSHMSGGSAHSGHSHGQSGGGHYSGGGHRR